MGYGAEQDWFDENEEESEDLTVWVGQDGARYQVAKMKKNHIKNCIRMITTKRFNNQWLEYYGDDWLEVFESELSTRG